MQCHPFKQLRMKTSQSLMRKLGLEYPRQGELTIIDLRQLITPTDASDNLHSKPMEWVLASVCVSTSVSNGQRSEIPQLQGYK